MASKALVDIALKLAKQLGANTNKFLGSRTNISFLGKGPKDDLLFQQDINMESLGAIPLSKVVPQIESSMGYLTGGKLNDIQANKLIDNMTKMKEFHFPSQIPNITDMATGTRDLTQEGLGSLRGGKQVTVDTPDPRVLDKDGQLITPTASGLMGRIEGQMEKIKGTSSKLDDAIKGYEDVYRPSGHFASNVTENKAGHEFITNYVDDIYKNAGVTASADVPRKRAAAREFLYNILKKDTDLTKGGTLESTISEADYKYIMEGGGGALGDPLVLVQKYFGDEIAKRIPLDSSTEVIDAFVDNVRYAKDRSGRLTSDPGFNPDDIPEFAEGGIARLGFKWGSGLSRSLLKKINKRMIKDAVDDIFPTGDYKMDAELASEALVELNPKIFGGKLLDDLDDAARSDIYGLVLGEVSTRNASKLKSAGHIKQGDPITAENFGSSQFAPDLSGLEKARAFTPNKEMIRTKYKGKIDDRLLQQILVDDNPQRIAEVLATIDEALLMQGKGMGPNQIMETIRSSWGRKKNAHGGLAKILEV